MLLNGNVITVDKALSRAAAVAVSQGRFVRVGTDEAVRALVADGTRVMDSPAFFVWFKSNV